jgi:hypothetical protein
VKTVWSRKQKRIIALHSVRGRAHHQRESATIPSGVRAALHLLKDSRYDGEAAAGPQRIGRCAASECQQRPLYPPVYPCICLKTDGVFTARFSNDPFNHLNQRLSLLCLRTRRQL